MAKTKKKVKTAPLFFSQKISPAVKISHLVE